MLKIIQFITPFKDEFVLHTIVVGCCVIKHCYLLILAITKFFLPNINSDELTLKYKQDVFYEMGVRCIQWAIRSFIILSCTAKFKTEITYQR